MHPDIDIEYLVELARKAGRAIMTIYRSEIEVEHKEDNSPLTQADRMSHELIMAGLGSKYPDIPIISEEQKNLGYDVRKNWETLWLVDPLDGTKEFIKKNGEFTVNIALVHNGEPVLGVVDCPALDKTYFAKKGEGAFRQDYDQEPRSIKNGLHYSEKKNLTVVASRSHLSQEVTDFVDDLKGQGKEIEYLSAGSSLKFCLVAEGAADVYPRLAPTMEWDTGAADAVVREAGKRVLDYNTKENLQYNKENLLNPWFIVE